MIFYKTVIFLIYFNTFYIRKTLRRRGWLRSDAKLLFFCFVLFFLLILGIQRCETAIIIIGLYFIDKNTYSILQ